MTLRTYGWGMMAMLAVSIGVYAFAILAEPGFGAAFLPARFAVMPVAVYAHIAGGAAAMIIGVFQVNARIRQRWLARHRWLGRIYVGAVLIAAPAGLAMAMVSEGGWIGHMGFGLLAVLWFATTLMAFVQIRARNIAAHRQWMIRSYALTLAAVTLRLYVPGAIVSGIAFEAAYPVIAWFCWVPNLVFAEWFIRQTAQRVPAQAST